MKNNKIIIFFKKECVLIIATLLALITSLISMPKLEYIDFKVLILLFNLMVIVAALNKFKVLDKIAITLLEKCTTSRKVNLVLVFITFFSAMFVTNDVALITFVPLTIITSKKANINALKTIVFQTLGANLGSALTPMGNPQNLFIYSFYNMNIISFLKSTFPLILIGLVFLSILIFKEKDFKLNFNVEKIEIKDKNKIFLVVALFFLVILSVFKIIDYKITFILTIIFVVFLDKSLFKKVDYSLLLTFVAFFIFIGNISSMEEVKIFMENLFNSSKSTYFYSILSSQIISNVPATMLISNFTNYSKELLLGVNIGGMGTLIASLASLISYKLYVKEIKDENNNYIKVFTLYNLLGLIVIIPIIYFLCI
ncbi:SLC13 family permease [Clostridium ihumii]|uniref:SLC13 family permease n=1 Tax=Clostridium ihumii TaxID=1470356 RepID=UPI003D354FD8